MVHLASATTVVIDILAPLDPTENRNYPFGGNPNVLGSPGASYSTNYLNQSRWRITRQNFRGFKSTDFFCNISSGWLANKNQAQWNPVCSPHPYHDDASPQRVFGSHIVNLYHAYQNESFFPWDYLKAHKFGHTRPPGSLPDAQFQVATRASGSDTSNGQGWPLGPNYECCPTGPGIGWPGDGHGEIIGWRGPVTIVPLSAPQPLGVRIKTSPQCLEYGIGGCFGPAWPARESTLTHGVFTWHNPNPSLRVSFMKRLELLPNSTTWAHSPTNPNLCLVSPGLINLFDVMNRPPTARADADQSGGAAVTLDGSRSSDPDAGDVLTYTWSWRSGSASGSRPAVTLPPGVHYIQLEVKDPTGHIDQDHVTISVHL